MPTITGNNYGGETKGNVGQAGFGPAGEWRKLRADDEVENVCIDVSIKSNEALSQEPDSAATAALEAATEEEEQEEATTVEATTEATR